MRVCILGAGGLGSLLGGRLAESGVDVTLVARPAHAAAIRERGLEITGFRGSSVVRDHLRAVEDAAGAEGDFDYLVLLVKARDTEGALAGAGALRERTGCALSLQNTVVKDEQLARWIGRERVIGGMTIEGGTLVGPGAVRHTATAPVSAYFGELDGGTSDRVDALSAAVNAAGIAARPADDIGHVEWEKLLQIAVVAGWSGSVLGALGGSVAEGLAVREAAEDYVQLATELLAVYRALGYEPQDFFAPFSRFRELDACSFDEAVDLMMNLAVSMREQGFIGRPSLHDDLLRGKPTEVDFCVGAYLDEAEKHDVAVPTVRAAYRVVKSLEYWLVGLGGVEPHDRLPVVDAPPS
jgi:2-dehydropantoate 2-reductase